MSTSAPTRCLASAGPMGQRRRRRPSVLLPQPPGLRPTLLLLLLLLAAGGVSGGTTGCTTEVVGPDCDSALQLVIHGRVNQQEVLVESREIAGRWLTQSFYFALPDPHRTRGSWLLQFGYNPELKDLGFIHEVNLANDMHDKLSGPFTVLSHRPDPGKELAEQRCEPRDGELCGGLRIYDPDMFEPEDDLPDERPDSGYLPVKSGFIRFSTFSARALAGTFDLTLDWDRKDPLQGTGRIEGCFRANRVREYQGDLLQ